MIKYRVLVRVVEGRKTWVTVKRMKRRRMGASAGESWIYLGNGTKKCELYIYMLRVLGGERAQVTRALEIARCTTHLQQESTNDTQNKTLKLSLTKR